MFPTRPVLPGEASPTALLGCAALSRGHDCIDGPRDKRQQKKLIPLCIILFARPSAGPGPSTPRGASVSRPNELFSYVLPACLPALIR